MSTDFSQLRGIAKTEFEKKLVDELELQVQSRQHKEVDAEPDATAVGKGEIQMRDDGKLYFKLSDGTLYYISGTSV